MHMYENTYVLSVPTGAESDLLVPDLLGRNFCGRRATSAHNAVTQKINS